MTDLAERETVLSFRVPGRPIPKGRPRVADGHAYTPERTRDAEQTIGACAAIAMGRAGLRGPIIEPLGLRVTFAMPDRRRADLDNLLKAVLDGAQRIVWANDDLVEEVVARRLLDPTGEGVTIIEVWKHPNPGEYL